MSAEDTKPVPEDPQTAAEKSTPPSQRTAQPVDATEKPRLPFPVVAIGGSAGGLEAFIELFQAMPAKTGMAFIIIQHLPPRGESMLADIMSKKTSLTVHEIEDGVIIKPNHIYTIRPGKTLTIEHGKLRLGDRIEKAGGNHPIDDFFRSLAEEQRERAIGIIMSGMGSNGTLGAQVIKAVGGLCIAQDPASAKFPSMPHSVIESGYADYILTPAEIPAALLRYAQHPYAAGTLPENTLHKRDSLVFKEILSLLRTRTRHEFAGYKKPTLVRRIQRRMGLNQVQDLPDYARLLRQRPAEAQALSDDLLIHVTGFFRDNQAWETLQKRVIAPIVAEREDGSAIRAWVSACSSGEEAYTLAMLVIEAAEAVHKKFDVKIFATDTADRALGLARSGVYPGGIEAEIRSDRVERFFQKADSTFHVAKEVREMVIFAPHDILQDPPFSQLDLITCRNLLIYLEPEVQKKLLSLLHFGLRPGGALFLGTSETVAGAEQLFEPLDKHWRIYRRLEADRRRTPLLPLVQLPESAQHGGLLLRPPPRVFSAMQLAQRKLLDQFTPPSVLVDRENRILYVHGDTGKFLAIPPGEPTRDLLTLLREHVRGAARNALQQALATGNPADARGVVVEEPDGRKRIRVTATPVEQKNAPPYLLLSFREEMEPDPPPRASQRESSPDLDLLEDELQRTREELQNAVQELQAANEELKASNEETTSVNEELQSTNEELETGKEELQSLNEELTTVNAQLHAKMEDLQNTTNDLEVLLSSADIAIVFLDQQLRIRRYTPMVSALFDMLPGDVGRPLSALAQKFADPTLLEDARDVLKSLVPRETQILATNGRWYQRKILPYRTSDNHIRGVVVTFVDTSHMRAVQAALHVKEESSRILVDALDEYAVFMLDPDGKITTWSAGARKIFGYTTESVLNRHFGILYSQEARNAGEPAKDLQTARTAGRIDCDRWYLRGDTGRFWGVGVLAAVPALDKQPAGFIQVLRDQTAGKTAQTISDDRQRENLANARDDSESKDQFLAVLGHELRTPLTAILLWARMLQNGQAGTQSAEAIDVILRGAEAQKQLIDDMLDIARMRSGRLRLNIRLVRLAEVIHGAAESVRPAVEAKSLVLDTVIDPRVGVVRADPDRLQQVVWNLLFNAAKFSPPGSHIRLEMKRVDAHVEILVADRGKGIPADFLPHIFQPFRQAENTSARHSGLGLGLAICRQLVELHGGTIAAESAPDQGATFTVRLPLPAVKDQHPSPENRPNPAGSPPAFLRGKLVLLVEDEPDGRNALATILRLAGADVSAHESPVAALETLPQRRPDLIISDISMPHMDGLAFIERVRALEQERKSPRAPALALTAFGAEHDFRRAFTAGFDKYTVKPVDPDALLADLRALVED